MTVTKIKRQIHSCILTSRHAKVVGLSPTILILNINLTCNQMWVLPATKQMVADTSNKGYDYAIIIIIIIITIINIIVQRLQLRVYRRCRCAVPRTKRLDLSSRQKGHVQVTPHFPVRLITCIFIITEHSSG